MEQAQEEKVKGGRTEDVSPPSPETLARWRRQGGRDDEKIALAHAANYFHVPLAVVRTAVERGVIKSETDDKGKVWIRRSELSRVKHWKLESCRK